MAHVCAIRTGERVDLLAKEEQDFSSRSLTISKTGEAGAAYKLCGTWLRAMRMGKGLRNASPSAGARKS